MPFRLMPAAAVLLFTVFTALAADAQIMQVKTDENQVTSWNRFAEKAYDLHKRQIAGRAIHKTEVAGQYYGTAARGFAYTETSYHDARTGLLLSRVRVDRDRPETLHIIEVFIYDGQGHVIRDYAAIYLPWIQNAPIRTMINLHRYNRDLHAYRQFDASGARVYEQCKGRHTGARVDISLYEHEIRLPATASDAYQACFAGVQQTAGIYQSPR